MSNPNNNPFYHNPKRQHPFQPHSYYIPRRHPHIPSYYPQYMPNGMMPLPNPLNYNFNPYGYPQSFPPYAHPNMPLVSYPYYRYPQIYEDQPRYTYQTSQNLGLSSTVSLKKQKPIKQFEVIEIKSDEEQQSKPKKQKQIGVRKEKSQEKHQEKANIHKHRTTQICHVQHKSSLKQEDPSFIKTKRIHKIKLKSDLPTHQLSKKIIKKDKISQKKVILSKTMKVEKPQQSQKKQQKGKNEERPPRDLMRYQDSHGKIRIGRDFQSNIPSFIHISSQLLVWKESKLKNLLSRQIQSTMSF